eukprot:scaffold3911_cov60-Phaeocystis_antarctica.AAC.1
MVSSQSSMVRGTLATPTITIAHATMREAKNNSLEMTLYRVARCMATSYSHHAPRSSSRPCSDVSFGSRSWVDGRRRTQQKGSESSRCRKQCMHPYAILTCA